MSSAERLDDLHLPQPRVPNLAHTVEDRLAEAGIAVHDWDLAEAGVRALLRIAGDDPDRAGLLDTPARVVRAWREQTDRPGDPERLLAVMFDDAGPVDEMVAVGPIPFASVCEHHLLPFTGHAHIAYIPTGGVVGLSKLPRLLHHFARRPQVQERLTRQITEALDQHVPSLGSACTITANHACATLRGVKTPAPMTTTSLTGLFKEDPSARTEFLAYTRT